MTSCADITDRLGGPDLVSVGVRRSRRPTTECPIGRTLGPEIPETPHLFSVRVIRVIRGRFFSEIGVH